MRIILANPRGICAGVNRAILIVKKALNIYGTPIYVYHEIVHNSYIIENLRQSGVIFVEKISEVPEYSILIFSAHGVSKSIYIEAINRNLKILDATCPLVTKIHKEVIRADKKNAEIILIGHFGHPEVNGIIGQYKNKGGSGGIYVINSVKDINTLNIKNTKNLFYIIQTTFSVDESLIIINKLYQRFPYIIGPYKDDICYATINRQEAVRKLAVNVDIVLIIGSKNSSNSNRLLEISKKICSNSYLIDKFCDIKHNWLKNINSVGIINSASAPDILVYQLISYLYTQGINKIEELLGNKENVSFKIPKIK